jgi:signal transduction histidine kinase
MEMGIRGPATPQQIDDLRRIQASQRHLLGLVNEVLNYARIETGTVRYDIADLPIASVVASVEPLIAPQVAAKGLRFSSDGCRDAAIVVRADREKTRQVLVNLLSNAVKFTDAPGAIEVRCEVRETYVLVHVRDTGIGIAVEELERVFEPFVQVNARLTRTHEGTGLGLAISRDLARGMQGDLTAESTPGVGSTFTLALPRA